MSEAGFTESDDRLHEPADLRGAVSGDCQTASALARRE